MPRPPSPTLRRRRLGAELRTLREALDLKVEDAARELDCSVGKVRHMETGRNVPKKPELTALVQMYGGSTEKHAELELLRQAGAKPGWWAAEGLPTPLETYVGAEDEALSVRQFTLELVPGLLQIEPY